MKALAGLAISVLCAAPAFAGCGHAKVIDRCLVGTWTYDGGVADLLKAVGARNLHVTNVTMSKVQLTFRADGAFATNPNEIRMTVTSGRGTMSAHLSMQTSGTWAADGGTMTRCVGPASRTTIETTLSGYPPQSYSPPPPPGTASFSTYTCNANSLTIVQPLARRLPLVLRYRRSH